MEAAVPILKQTFSHVFFEIVNMKYAHLTSMIKEINSIAEYFIDDEGYGLTFRVCKGTDQTFLWKLTVRIECTKVKSLKF